MSWKRIKIIWEIYFCAGVDVGTAINRSIAISERNKVDVVTNFNGIKVEVNAKSDPKEIYKKWRNSMDARSEEIK